jgi:hypothetical protein
MHCQCTFYSPQDTHLCQALLATTPHSATSSSVQIRMKEPTLGAGVADQPQGAMTSFASPQSQVGWSS